MPIRRALRTPVNPLPQPIPALRLLVKLAHLRPKRPPLQIKPLGQLAALPRLLLPAQTPRLPVPLMRRLPEPRRLQDLLAKAHTKAKEGPPPHLVRWTL